MVFSEIPDSDWLKFFEREVEIEKADGKSVRGLLIEIQESTVTVLKKNAEALLIEKSDVEKIKDATRSENIPLGQGYFLIDPVGFLSLGPALEAGLRIAPETTLGAHVRLMSYGLIMRLVTGIETGGTVSSTIAGGNILYYFKRKRSKDRLYFGLTVDAAWARFTTPYDSYEDINSMGWLGIAATFGYRLRFPSGLLINLGIMGGPLFGLWDRYWDTLSPDIVESWDPINVGYGAVEGSLGFEIGRNQ